MPEDTARARRDLIRKLHKIERWLRQFPEAVASGLMDDLHELEAELEELS